MDSLWSNLDKEDQTDQTEDDPLSSWDFQLDPDPGILNQHLNVIQDYFKETPINYESAFKRVKLIFTPQELFSKHITSKPTSYWKAINLAVLRERFGNPTTCFENPGIFYKYPNLGIIISKVPVKCHKVNMRKSGVGLKSYFQGLRWAIFEIVGGNSFHFDWKKWSNVSEILQ